MLDDPQRPHDSRNGVQLCDQLVPTEIVFGIHPQYAINLQLIGGVIILQTLPAVVLGLYTDRFDGRGLLAGCAVGLTWGLSMIPSISNLASLAIELGSVSILGWEPFTGSKIEIYPGLVALIGNLVVAAAVTAVLPRKEQKRPQPDPA